mmetsp:Transcript_44398/g.117804  ORF Transcript_44398/g.117804 Transcript_44398/m.117804 type:complete len:83 (+) Transcript_44398:55-303(+)
MSYASFECNQQVAPHDKRGLYIAQGLCPKRKPVAQLISELGRVGASKVRPLGLTSSTPSKHATRASLVFRSLATVSQIFCFF